MTTLINNYHNENKVLKDLNLNDYLKIDKIDPEFADELTVGYIMYQNNAKLHIKKRKEKREKFSRDHNR